METNILNKSVSDYVNSLEKVFEKRKQWRELTLPLLLKTLNDIQVNFNIGWQVQQLDWLMNNSAINITFNTFPTSLIEKLNGADDFEFIKGAALVFSQKYNGDISVFIIYPADLEPITEGDINEIGSFNPNEINENFITNKVAYFLDKIIIQEENVLRRKVGF
jgi:hypothetical protein